MNDDTLKAYVSSERARGIPDELIRTELIKKGWKESDVQPLLPREATSGEGTSLQAPFFLFSTLLPEALSMRFLRIGAPLFLLSSLALFVSGPGLESKNNPLFLAFALTHVANGAAAYFLFSSIWRLSHSVFFRAWIALLANIVALFAVLSFLHFLSIGAGLHLFDLLQQGLLGGDFLPLIIYFLLLPLQSVVFLLLAVTLWGLRSFRRRKNHEMVLLRPYMYVIGAFFVIAILAIGDLNLVLNNS